MGKESFIKIIEDSGPGQCYKCGGPLAAVDLEADYMALDEDGFPTNLETMMCKCEGVCLNCGTRIPLVRDGVGYRYYSEISIAIAQEKALKELKHDSPPEENPFYNPAKAGLSERKDNE